MTKKWGQTMCVHALLSVTILLSCTMNQNRVTTQSAEALTYYQQGVKDYYNNYLQRAVQHFSKAIQVDSTFALAYCRLSMTYHDLGDLTSAEKHMTSAKKLKSQITKKEKFFITICENKLLGNFQRRTVLLKEFFEKYPDDRECRLLIAEDCNARHLYNQAEAHLIDLLRIDPENLPANKLLALTYSKFNQFEKAERHIRACFAVEPNDADAIVLFGDMFRFQGKYESAQQEYYRAIELLPNFHEAHLHLGELYLETGKFEKALQQFHLAYELLPCSPNARSIEYAKIAEVHFMTGRLNKASESALRSLSLNEDNIKALAILGKMHLIENKISDAMSLADKIQAIIKQGKSNQLFPDGELYDLMGEIACKENDWKTAIESYRLAWQHSSEENGIRFQIQLAENFLRIGDYRQAKHFCDNVIRRNPNLARSHFFLAQVHEGLENFAAAEMEYRIFISLASETNLFIDELKIAQKRIHFVNTRNFAVNR